MRNKLLVAGTLALAMTCTTVLKIRISKLLI